MDEVLPALDHKINSPNVFRQVMSSIAGAISVERKQEPLVVEGSKPPPWLRLLPYIGVLLADDPKIWVGIGGSGDAALPGNKDRARVELGFARASI